METELFIISPIDCL